MIEVKPCGYPVPTGYMGQNRQGKWQEYATESEYREEFEEVLRKEQEKNERESRMESSYE